MHKTQATVDGSITLKNGGWRKLCGSGDCNLCSRQQAVDQARCDRLPGGAQGGWVGGLDSRTRTGRTEPLLTRIPDRTWQGVFAMGQVYVLVSRVRPGASTPETQLGV